MSARFFNRVAVATLALLAVGLGSIGLARAGGPQQAEKIEFSEVPVANPVVVTNLNRLAPSEGGFKQVKEDLFRPFSSLDPRNSLVDSAMGSPLPVPQRSAQPMSKHAREMLDKQRNWAFSSYEELYAPQDEVEKKMFGVKEYGPDGQEKKATSAFERYYESFDNKHLTATNQTAEEARAEFINQNGFDPLGKAVHGNSTFTKDTFQLEAPDALAAAYGGPVLTKTSATAIAGVSSTQELGGRRTRTSELDMLRQSILGDAAFHAGRPGDGSDPLLTTDDTLVKTNNGAGAPLNPLSAFGTDGKEKSATPFVVVDPTANVLHSHVNDDLTARALGLPNPSTAATNIYRAPTAQSIQAQQDPFGAARPKPRF